MREQDARRVGVHHRHGASEVRARAARSSCPEVVDAQEGEAAAVARADRPPLVQEEIDAGRAHRRDDPPMPCVVVVVAEDGRDAVPAAEIAQHVGGRRVVRAGWTRAVRLQ